MSARARLPLVLIAAVLPGAGAFADEAKTAALAQRLWAITDVVLEQHVNPPARQEMLLAAAKALTARSQPDHLARRLSGVATVEQLARLLEELRVEATDPGTNDIVVNALLSAVPGDTQFVPPGALKALEQLGNNRYVGTGIQIRTNAEEELVQIVVPFPGGPARKAGAKPGDLIVAVDGVEMKGKRLTEVVEKLRGDEGTKVSVVVRQPGEKTTRTLDMVRSVVPFESAVGCRRVAEEAWEFRPDAAEAIAYVRLLTISSSTPIELAKLEPRLREEGAKAIVLDLRSAHAPQFQPLTLVADTLLDGGLMWKVRDAHNRVKEYKADRDCVFRGWPMAALVDAETEPMVTLLTAALQDAKRAAVVGGVPRESGWVTGLVKLGDGQGGLQLRTGAVERPGSAKRSQRPIRLGDALAGGWLLEPDHEVTLTRKQKEAVWEYHAAQDRLQIDEKRKAPDDPQLARAQELLRESLKGTPR